ncbi:MAG: hypothetical protein ACE5FA_10175 [Dehalococcoidia bacterium]
MLLVSSDYQNDRLDIEDSCPHCLDRLTLTIENSKQTRSEPTSIYSFYGGG